MCTLVRLVKLRYELRLKINFNILRSNIGPQLIPQLWSNWGWVEAQVEAWVGVEFEVFETPYYIPQDIISEMPCGWDTSISHYLLLGQCTITVPVWVYGCFLWVPILYHWVLFSPLYYALSSYSQCGVTTSIHQTSGQQSVSSRVR